MAFRVPATGSLTSLAKSAPSAIMRGFIGGSPRMAILSNGSGAEASSPLEKTSAGGRARRPISKSRFSRNGIFACPSAAFSGRNLCKTSDLSTVQSNSIASCADNIEIFSSIREAHCEEMSQRWGFCKGFRLPRERTPQAETFAKSQIWARLKAATSQLIFAKVSGSLKPDIP